jgi:hypothetical protein
VREVQKAAKFTAVTAEHEYTADSLVVATGGLSIPKMGATDFGYLLAAQFGLNIIEPRPALVAFTLSAEDAKRWCELAGLSTEVVVSCGKRSFTEKLLVTHHGFSGPAILQISTYWQPGEKVTIDWVPGKQVFAAMLAKDPHLLTAADVGHQGGDATIPRLQKEGRHGAPSSRRDFAAALACLRAVLPARLAERWLELHPFTRWTNAAIEEAEQALHRFEFLPAGTEGFGKAEVTAGGVDTDELDAKTMQAKKVPGLYFIGEVVDVTGWLGGYNFQWAWASGWSAGQVV